MILERRAHLGPLLKAVRGVVGSKGFLGLALSRLMARLSIEESAVGMSTVPEVIVANHCGMRVLALSGIPNLCIDDLRTEDTVTHEDVKRQMASQVVPKIIALVRGIIRSQPPGEDVKDITLGLETDGLGLWMVPIRLCVPWSSVLLALSLGVMTVTALAAPSETYHALLKARRFLARMAWTVARRPVVRIGP